METTKNQDSIHGWAASRLEEVEADLFFLEAALESPALDIERIRRAVASARRGIIDVAASLSEP